MRLTTTGQRLQSVVRRYPTLTLAAELALVPALASLCLLLLGVTLWTQPHSPDTEFYFTLAAFGNQVTDTAAEAAYYWTRVGVIAPLRGLISLFGVSWGYRLWHLGLVAIALTPSYHVMRRLWGRVAAATGSLFILLNLVFLTALGNPYVTSAIVPLLIAESALLAGALVASTRRGRTSLLILTGVCVGWIAACNQLASVLAVSLGIVGLLFIPRRPFRESLGGFMSACWAAITTFLALVFAGSIIFPLFNWWTTTRYWLGVLKPSDYHSDGVSWFWSNPALLVPVVLALAAASLARQEASFPRRVCLLACTLTGVGVSFGLWYQFIAKGGFLEFQAYSPYLWGPALFAGAVSVAVLVHRAQSRWLGLAACAAGLLGGAFSPAGDGLSVWPVGILLACTALGLVAFMPDTRHGATRILLPLGCLLVPFVVQYLQAATGNPAGLTFGRVSYSAVLRGQDFEAEYMQDLAIARWVLAQPGLRRYMVWTANLGLGGPGAMFFFGPNAVSLDSIIRPAGADYARAKAPSHIVMLGHSRAELDDVRQSLATITTKMTPQRCRVFTRTRPDVEVHVCVAEVRF